MIELLSVNVGLPAVIGARHGEPVLSSIRKSPVLGPTVEIVSTNIAGDQQGDLSVHGGPDKAIFAYPSQHLELWTTEFGATEPFRPGQIGDNLTIGNRDETEVRIGDVWQWGSAALQICQPRYPCFKLAMATGFPLIVKRFLATGRSGWYLRVLEAGTAQLTDSIQVVSKDPVGLSVRRAALAVYGEFDNGERLEISEHPALAASWRSILIRLAASPA